MGEIFFSSRTLHEYVCTIVGEEGGRFCGVWERMNAFSRSRGGWYLGH